jgi:DNA mismatch endonuclease (patch repair protein)
MTDVFSKSKRSEVMSRIKGRNTKPELAVGSLLHRMGYGFRLHKADLPGKPDIVLSRYKTVIFVHGCFWHPHKNCRFAYTPKSRTEFWLKKLESNVIRDIQVKSDLELSGWRVITVWECELRELEQISARLNALLKRYVRV